MCVLVLVVVLVGGGGGGDGWEVDVKGGGNTVVVGVFVGGYW